MNILKKIIPFLIVMGGVYLLDLAGSRDFKQKLFHYSTKSFIAETGAKFAIDDFSPKFPFGLTLSNFQLELPNGSTLYIGHLELDSSPDLLLTLASGTSPLPQINFRAQNVHLNDQHPSIPTDLNIKGSIKKETENSPYELNLALSSMMHSTSAESTLFVTNTSLDEIKGTLSLTSMLDRLPIKLDTSICWKGIEDVCIEPFYVDFNNQAVTAKGIIKLSKQQVFLDLEHFELHKDLLSDFPILSAKATANIMSGHAEVFGEITGMGPSPFALTAKLPFNDSDPLEAHLHGEVDIGTFLHMVADELPGLAGHADLQFALFGNWKDPHLTGKAEVTNGSYEGLNTGVAFQNITGSLEADLQKLEIRTLTATDGMEGHITGAGHLYFDPDRNFPFELSLDLENTLLFARDEAMARGNGHVILDGDMEKGKLAGSLNISKFDITLPKRLSPRTSSLEITYINTPKGKSYNPADQQKGGWPLAFDLHIDSSSNILVHGRGVTSEWRGHLDITGDTTTPLFNGEMRLESGEYDLRGRLFNLKRGTLTFAGPFEKGTTINLLAQRQFDRITAEMVLRGPLIDPTLTLRSNPPLPQKEVLSYILFNQGTTDITPSQGDELTRSLTSLSDSGDAPDLLGTIRSRLGVDKLEISRSSDGTTPTFKVGKNLTKNVSVSVTKGISTDPNRVSLEANLMPHIKAEAEVGDDAQGTLSLKWRRDY